MNTRRKKAGSQKSILTVDEFAPQNVKIRITTFVDQDVLALLRQYAKKKGIRYQTALNSLLRSFFIDGNTGEPATLSEDRVRQIVKEELRKRA